jgi:hypothetical protein
MSSLRSYLFSLFVGTLVAFTVWLAILITIDPTSTDIITKAAFFASFFLALTGLLTFILVYIMSVLTKHTATKLVYQSLVRSSLLSFVATFMLILETLKVLGLWEMIIILALYLLVEFYTQTGRRIA